MTDDDTILKEYYEDRGKALYWHNKKHDNNWQIEVNRLIDEVSKTGQDKIGRITDYTSKNGNKWRVFDVCRYHGKGVALVYANAFMYWNTIGSVGAVLPSNDDVTGSKGVIILTNHFFLRVAQRRKTVADLNLVMAFLMLNRGMLLEASKDENGKPCVDVRLEGGIGRGKLRKSGNDITSLRGSVVEIKTYLKDVELSNGQKRDTKNLYEVAEYVDDRPVTMLVQEAMESDDTFKAIGEFFEKRFRTQGAPKGFGRFFNKVVWLAVNCLVDISPENVAKGDGKVAKSFIKIANTLNKPLLDYFVANGADIKNHEVVQMCFDVFPKMDGNKALVRYGCWMLYNKGKSIDEVMRQKAITEKWLNDNNICITKENCEKFFKESAIN